MQSLYERYKDSGFEILAVSVDDIPAAVPEYMKEMELTFPALLDNRKKVARLYGFWSTPTTYFVTREGMIIGSRIGGREWDSEAAGKFMEWFLEQ